MKLSNGIRVIAINPGSTSTKIAVYENETPVLIKNITHTPEELAPFEKITDQFEFRKNIICKVLKDAEIRMDLVHAVVGRGGLVKPIESGVYLVNKAMIKDLINSPSGAEHASNLGGLIAADMAKNIPNASVWALDVSEKALAVAKKNATLNKVEIQFLKSEGKFCIGAAFYPEGHIEADSLEKDIDALISKMNEAIGQSNTFIEQMGS